MRLVPNAVSRKVAMQSLKAHKNAPEFLFAAGLLGVVGSTVLACKATLQLETVLDDIQHDIEQVRELSTTEHAILDQDPKRTIAITYVSGAGRLVKLYTPAILLGGASVCCLTKSHSILVERNLGLATAYAAVDGAMKKYRGNVVEKYGPEIDQAMRHGYEETMLVDDEGIEHCDIRVRYDSEPSMYAKFFDEYNENWAEEAEYNFAWLRNKEDWFNHLLTMRGYLYLNEVYEALGFEPSEAGNVVGWFLGNRDGDSYVDLHLMKSPHLVNGREASILLDFNVDGPIFHLMDQIDHSKKRGFTPWQR